MNQPRSAANSTGLRQFLAQLHSIKIGGASDSPENSRLSKRKLCQFFDLMSMLLENGLSLQKALLAMERDRSQRSLKPMLKDMRRNLESGQSLSSILGMYPKIFNKLTVKQMKIAERSGTIVESFRRVATNLERQRALKKRIVKKLSYPATVVFAGISLFVFVMLTVIPQFKDLFSDSSVQLPLATRVVYGLSEILTSYGLFILGFIIVAGTVFFQLRKRTGVALWIDAFILKIPVVGNWIRDASILRFIEAVSTMSEAGFVPADAISESVDAVSNRSIRRVLLSISEAIRSGNKLSHELAKHPDIFPETVGQLIVVGEQTGSLAEATKSVHSVLQQQLESQMDAALGAMEPVITIGLASAIGTLVLAIYMPMFNMFDVLE